MGDRWLVMSPSLARCARVARWLRHFASAPNRAQPFRPQHQGVPMSIASIVGRASSQAHKDALRSFVQSRIHDIAETGAGRGRRLSLRGGESGQAGHEGRLDPRGPAAGLPEPRNSPDAVAGVARLSLLPFAHEHVCEDPERTVASVGQWVQNRLRLRPCRPPPASHDRGRLGRGERALEFVRGEKNAHVVRN